MSETEDPTEGEALARGAERLLTLSDPESRSMQLEIFERLALRGHAPTRRNMLRTAGLVTDDEWVAAVGRMRAAVMPETLS